MLDTPPQDTLQSVCDESWVMLIMEDSKMSKIEYDLKAIMYSTYDTSHKL